MKGDMAVAQMVVPETVTNEAALPPEVQMARAMLRAQKATKEIVK